MRRTLALLCLAAALPASTLKKKAEPDYSLFQKKLSKDRQAVHALDRLTFGPRPGDVEAVQKAGLKKWIDLQLHPDRIKDNPALAQRLPTVQEATTPPPPPARLRQLTA